jgi:allantoin racemase
VPVVGMTEAACLVACTLGGPFGIVTYGARSAAILREIVAGYGLASRLAGVHGLDASPADMLKDPDGLQAQIAGAACDLARRNNAEAVILAGAVMAGLPPLLQPQVPCPLVEGIACGIGVAELLARLAPVKAQSGSFAAIGERASDGLGPELAAVLGRKNS